MQNNLKFRNVLSKEEQSANARRLFEMVLAGATFSQAATVFGRSIPTCRNRFFRLARLTVRRRSFVHRNEPSFNAHHVSVMRQHKDAWLGAYDHALNAPSMPEWQDPHMVSIYHLQLSSRAETCLTHAGIKTLGNILNITEDEFLKKRYLGKYTLQAIKALLTRLGLSFKPAEVLIRS